MTEPPPTHPFSDTPPPRPEDPPPSSLPGRLEPRRAVGRPLLLTREVADKIVEAVEQGSYLKIAAQAAGVSQATLQAWLARGRQAASTAAQHDDDEQQRIAYCPQCGGVREPAAPDEVLVACPVCGNGEPPGPWTLPATEAPFLELLEAVTLAQAQAETTAVAAWRRAFTGTDPDWRAARDYLSRTAPERWAGVTRVQMTTDEAERRIDDAVNEALLALGVDQLVGDDADFALDEPDEQDEPADA